MKIEKQAEKFLPQDLQDVINTFIKQFNIMEEYNLDYIPTHYTANLFETMAKYPEYNSVLLDLMDLIENEELQK